MAAKVNEYHPQSVSPPGHTLEAKLYELDLDFYEFAALINEESELVFNIFKGNERITEELAAKFEEALKIPATFWLNRQKRYDKYEEKVTASVE